MKHLFLLGFLAVSGAAVCAAPASQAGMGFNMTMRVTATGQNQLPPQTVQAKVLLSGSRARIETQTASSRSVTLFAPPYIYNLLPSEKAGVRYKIPKSRGDALAGGNLQAMLRDPSKIRGALLQGGAKRTGTTVLSGVPVDIFDIAKPVKGFSKARAWIRRSDSLPARLEATRGGIKIVASWSGYTKLASVNAAQFAPPKGFAIRESQNPPMLSGF